MTALASYAAIGLLVAGAAVAGSGDYVLLLPTGEEVCAKSADTCNAAIRAIERGWWPILPSGSGLRCEPRPRGCFPESSNHIKGYN
jgi:hypothetical protein